METTRSFPLLRTAVTSLPAADTPICHKVIKRHFFAFRELAPGLVPPGQEPLTHPEGKQEARTRALRVPKTAEQGGQLGANRQRMVAAA